MNCVEGAELRGSELSGDAEDFAIDQDLGDDGQENIHKLRPDDVQRSSSASTASLSASRTTSLTSAEVST